MSLDTGAASIAVVLAINLLLTGAPLAIGAGIAFRLTRDFAPRARYIIAVIVFGIAAFYPVWATFSRSEQRRSSNSSREASVSLSSPSAVDNENPFIAPKLSLPPAAADSEIERAAAVRNDLPSTGFTVIADSIAESGAGAGLLFLWLAGSAGLIGRDALGHLRLKRARRKWAPAGAGLRRKLMWNSPVSLLIDEHRGPGTVGFLRPVIVVPSGLFSALSPEAARHIALHELSHARWRDPLVNTLVRLVRAAFWISPPLWVLEKMIRTEREVAADKAAVSLTRSQIDGCNNAAIEYANSLVQAAYQLKNGAGQENKKGYYDLTTTHFGQPDGLETRVNRLFIQSSRLSYARMFLAFLVIAAGISGVASLPLPGRVHLLPKQFSEENQPQRELTGDFSPEHNLSIDTTSRTGIRNKQEPGAINPRPAQKPGIEQDFSQNELLKPDVATIKKTTGTETQSFVEPQSKSETIPVAAIDYRQQPGSREKTQITSFADEMAAAGYANLSSEELSDLDRQGVSANFVRALQRLGFNNLAPEELTELRKRDITPEFIGRMQAAGFTGLSIDNLIKFKNHDITPEFVNLMKAEGVTIASVKDAIKLKTRGISVEFIRRIKARGISDLSMDKLKKLRDEESD